MRRLIRAIAVTAAVALPLAGPAAADVTLVYKSVDKLPSASTSTTTYRISGGKLALTSVGDRPIKALYDLKGDELTIIDDEAKKYSTVDHAGLEQVAARISTISATLDSVMASLTPEQRAMVQKNMGAMAGGPAPEPHEVETLEMTETRVIGKWNCHRNDVVTDGVKSAEIWATAVADSTTTAIELMTLIGFSGIMQDFLDAVSTLSKSIDLEMPTQLSVSGEIEGLPVYAKNLEGDAIKSELTLESLSRGTIPAATFAIPKGYEKKALDPELPDGK